LLFIQAILRHWFARDAGFIGLTRRLSCDEHGLSGSLHLDFLCINQNLFPAVDESPRMDRQSCENKRKEQNKFQEINRTISQQPPANGERPDKWHERNEQRHFDKDFSFQVVFVAVDRCALKFGHLLKPLTYVDKYY
jgi:hypothetical protein